ncbi:hypothetical protein [Nonomuraea sp. NPDC001023]|uniref:hypothetical protein n=1 Tax=unclassified Nonomuraea TaxID=2593643 RepID=UPI0033258F2C
MVGAPAVREPQQAPEQDAAERRRGDDLGQRGVRPPALAGPFDVAALGRPAGRAEGAGRARQDEPVDQAGMVGGQLQGDGSAVDRASTLTGPSNVARIAWAKIAARSAIVVVDGSPGGRLTT